MTRTTIKIDGMSCGHCVTSVKKALESLPGTKVEEVAVGIATIEYDPNVASPENITEAISEAGYTVAAAS